MKPQFRDKELSYQKATGKQSRFKIHGTDNYGYEESYVVALENQCDKLKKENEKLTKIVRDIHAEIYSV